MATRARTLRALIQDRQHARLLRLSFPQGGEPANAELVVNKLQAREGLCRDFEFTAELLSDNADIPLKDLQGKMLCISLVRPDGTLRHFTGIVFAFRLVRTDGNLAFYEAQLGPWLRYLRLRTNNRLFHRKTLQEQTQLIFNDYGVLPKWKWVVRGEDAPITMATQGGGIGETDHNYLHRRWEAAGYSYRWEHDHEGHTLVLSDDSTLFPPIDVAKGAPAEIRYQSEGGAAEEDAVHQWSPVRDLVSSRTAVSAFDFKNPRPQHQGTHTGNQQGEVLPLEVHEYGGHRHFKTSGQGHALATRRMEEIEAVAKHFEAQGNNRFTLPGRWFRLTDHFGRIEGKASDSEFLILAIEHNASNNYLQAEDEAAEYKSTFSCSRRFIPWRPGRGFHSHDQRVMAPQTATVVGAAPEGALHTDEYGRIRVQFHWDREGRDDEGSSAWVRVMTSWAGGETGALSIPRVGSEVVMQCLDGNPDHFIVMGVVWNAQRMPPWKLPAQKALTGLRSRELTDSGNAAGGRSNHLVLDDTEGKIQTQLKSDEQSSSLSLGHITRIEDTAGRKDPRGKGFELRTDGHGAVRAKDGLLISTEARQNARAHITDMAETVQRLTQGRDLHEGLSEAAQEAKAHESGDQDEVTKALKAQNDAIKGSGGDKAQGQFPELTEPHLVLASPAGIEATTGGSTHLASNEHNAFTSGGHTSVSTGKSFLVSSKDAVRIAAFEKGIRMVAAAADIDIQALKNCINVIAKLDIKVEANKISITAKEEVLINGGTSYSKWNASGIEHGTKGLWREHASVHSLVGPNSLGSPTLPKTMKLGKGQLDLFNHYLKPDGDKRQGVKQGEYTVTDAEGGVHKGSLDGQGFASVAGLPIGTAKVVFGKDPRDPWDEASHFPESEMWPAKAIGDSVASGSTGGTAGGAGGVGEARVWQGAPALRSATAAAANGLGSLGNAAVALGQAGQAAGMARQAAGAVQAVKQGGAKAVLGQPGQIVGMAAGAASGIVGVAGLSGAVGGFAGPTVPSMAKLPGALPSAGADRVAGGMRTLPGQTPGFAG